jgi:hypothetical protein
MIPDIEKFLPVTILKNNVEFVLYYGGHSENGDR